MSYERTFELYEAKRDTLSAWVDRHYISRFGLQPCRLLDAACGNGFWASVFAERAYQVDAFDLHAGYIDEGRELYPAVTYEVADVLEPLPFPERAYDVVFVRTLPQFYADSLADGAAAVRNLLRHVAPGGILLATAYTDGSDRTVDGFRYHPAAAYTEMLAAAGAAVVDHEQVVTYLIYAAQPTEEPAP